MKCLHCVNLAIAKGLCSTHYSRTRPGRKKPLTAPLQTANGEADRIPPIRMSRDARRLVEHAAQTEGLELAEYVRRAIGAALLRSAAPPWGQGCPACLGYGHFSLEDGGPSLDKGDRKCLNCGGTGMRLTAHPAVKATSTITLNPPGGFEATICGALVTARPAETAAPRGPRAPIRRVSPKRRAR